MVLLSNPKQCFRKQYVRGVGRYYSDIYGGGIFLNSLKSLGKYFFKSGKSLYNLVKPKAISFVKDSITDIKPKVQKVVTDASAKLIDNLINKPTQIKESSKEMIDNIKTEMKDIVNETLPSIKERGKKSFHELINGGGLKLNKRKLSKKNQMLLKEMIEYSKF